MSSVLNLESIDDILLKLDTLYLFKLCIELYRKPLSYLLSLLTLLTLFRASPNGEYSNLTFPTIPDLYRKYSPVYYPIL